ncbi:MAG: hypothetical protein KDC46_06380 [Thermoleophilia bacterium]|nr:hypothetical protein [Thermoleophilia bacterium]
MDKARAFTCIESDPDDPMLGNWSVSPVKTKVFKKNGTKITVGSSKLTNGCYGFGWKSVLTGRENIYATTNKLTIYATDSTNTVGTYQSLGIVQTAVVDSDVIRLAPPGA